MFFKNGEAVNTMVGAVAERAVAPKVERAFLIKTLTSSRTGDNINRGIVYPLIVQGGDRCRVILNGILLKSEGRRLMQSAARCFTKLTREIIVAARKGGGSIEGNYSLRLAVQRAKGLQHALGQ